MLHFWLLATSIHEVLTSMSAYRPARTPIFQHTYTKISCCCSAKCIFPIHIRQCVCVCAWRNMCGWPFRTILADNTSAHTMLSRCVYILTCIIHWMCGPKSVGVIMSCCSSVWQRRADWFRRPTRTKPLCVYLWTTYEKLFYSFIYYIIFLGLLFAVAKTKKKKKKTTRKTKMSYKSVNIVEKVINFFFDRHIHWNNQRLVILGLNSNHNGRYCLRTIIMDLNERNFPHAIFYESMRFA